MPAGLDEALEQHAIVAERPGGLATRAGERLGQFRGRSHDPHALAAATGGRLDEQRKAQAFGFLPQVRGRLLGAVVTGQHRHAGRGHQAARLALRAHPQDRGLRRADEHQPAVAAGARKRSVLGQEPVTRVDASRAARSRRRDDRVDVEVALARRRRTDRAPPRRRAARAARCGRPPNRRRSFAGRAGARSV